MPQMSPLLWFNLYMYNTILIIIIISLIYNIYIYKHINLLIFFKKFSYNFKW